VKWQYRESVDCDSLMNHERFEEYQKALEETIRQVSARRHQTEEIAIERVPDSMDDVVLANQRDLALEAINREALILQQASDALRRIRLGTYGVCKECGQPIAPKRLAVVPWAALCLHCQDADDRRAGARLNYSSRFSSAA
jgi:DnaK suppressor protein